MIDRFNDLKISSLQITLDGFEDVQGTRRVLAGGGPTFQRILADGWNVSKIGNILELHYGKALKQENRRGGNVPVFGSSGVVGYHDVPLVNGSGKVVGRKGNVGSIFWSDKDFYPIDTAYYVYCKRVNSELFYIDNSIYNRLLRILRIILLKHLKYSIKDSVAFFILRVSPL